MNIFCDESGGTRASNECFVVAAISASTKDAARLVRRLRKATGRSGEIKGHTLTLIGRRIFFDLLLEQHDIACVALTCGRADAVGGWAISSFREIELYKRMLVEACGAAQLGSTRAIDVVIDRTRYKTAAEQRIARLAEEELRQRFQCRIVIRPTDSARSDGIQIADVIANSVYHARGRAKDTKATQALLDRCIEAGQLTIERAPFSGSPQWLEGA